MHHMETDGRSSVHHGRSPGEEKKWGMIRGKLDSIIFVKKKYFSLLLNILDIILI